MIEFDDLIAPMSREEFIRDYWTKSYLRIPGVAGRFSGLFTWDELDSVLEQHRLFPPRVKLFKDGKEIDPAQYVMGSHMGAPRLDPGGLAISVADGATLILNDAHEVSPRVRLLMHKFQDAFRIHAYANLYAAWHSQKAFDLHWDAQESFVFQLSGKKRWRVYKPTRLYPMENDVDQPAPPTGNPFWAGVMKEGDILYVPRGWWHVAMPLNEPSLHLTVSMSPPKNIDFLEWAVEKLRQHHEVRADFPIVDGVAAHGACVRSMTRFLDGVLNDESIAEFLTRWDANISPCPRIRLLHASYEQFAPLNPGSRVRLAGLHSLPLLPVEDYYEFHAVGKLWSVPRVLKTPLSLLRNTHDLSIAELLATLNDAVDRTDLIKSLGVLARAGIVLVEKSD